MRHYGIVNFDKGGEDAAKAQDILLKALKKSGIIKLSAKRIKEIYETDRVQLTGFTCNFVLDDDKETEEFRRIMRSPELKKDWIRWRTTTRLGKENEFRKWLEKRGVYEDV